MVWSSARWVVDVAIRRGFPAVLVGTQLRIVLFVDDFDGVVSWFGHVGAISVFFGFELDWVGWPLFPGSEWVVLALVDELMRPFDVVSIIIVVESLYLVWRSVV